MQEPQTDTSELKRPASLPATVCTKCRNCRHSLADLSILEAKLKEELNRLRFPGKYKEQQGNPQPFRVHHQFKITLAGCPNGCSQPPIKDLAIIIHQPLQFHEEKCNYCGRCQQVCPDQIISVTENKLTIDSEHCLDCAVCSRECPTEALELQETYYQLLVGGRLGRRPQLAQELLCTPSQQTLLSNITSILTDYLEKGKPGERFASFCVRELLKEKRC